MFEKVGQIVYPAKAGSEDKIMEAAIDAGAQDAESDEETHTIFSAFEDLSAVSEALEGILGAPKSTAIVWRPKVMAPASSEEVVGLFKLIDALDDDDDVSNVYSNLDLTDEQMAAMGE